jgi:hypothetical protein
MCFFSVFEGQEIGESCPKNSKFSSGKTYIPTIFSKKSFPFCKKFAPKIMLLPGKNINCQHLPNFLKKKSTPYIHHVYPGFSFTLVETHCTNAHSQLLIPLKTVVHIPTY